MSDLFFVPPTELLYSSIVFAAISLLPLLEMVALIRVPRIAGQRTWRQWLAVLPGLMGVVMLAITGALVVIYIRLTNDSTYVPQAFRCFNGQCQPTIDANAQQALQLFRNIANSDAVPIIGLYAVLLYGFIALTIGRRRKAA